MPLDALERWLHTNETRVHDPLAFVSAIDAVRRDPSCVECRRSLRGLLWTVLPRPPANVRGVATQAPMDVAIWRRCSQEARAMNLSLWLAVLALAVVLAWVRLGLWQRRVPVARDHAAGD